MGFWANLLNTGGGAKSEAARLEEIKKKGLRRVLQKRQYTVDLLMKNWRTAKDAAQNPYNPDRTLLYALYESVMLDDRLLSQVRTARFTVQLSAFDIRDEKKKIYEDLHELFETNWFNEYLEIAVDTELWGHSLIEFAKDKSSGMFNAIELMYRENVKPESGVIVLQVHDISGLNFRENPVIDTLFEMGKPNDLGLLLSISKNVIKKEYSITDWSRRNERFGIPFITVKTASRDEKELDAKEDMLRNMGSNMYAILDDQDDINLHESVMQGQAHLTFKLMAEYVDEGIALLVNGQTGSSTDKSYVGAAEVHERILNKYVLARMRRIQNHINENLFPFLIRHGYPLEGKRFQFHDLMEEDKDTSGSPIGPKAEPDPEPGKDPKTPPDPDAKKKASD